MVFLFLLSRNLAIGLTRMLGSNVPAVGSWLCFKFIWNLDGSTGSELSVWRNSKSAPLVEAEVGAVEAV